jgi:hypothetical protein
MDFREYQRVRSAPPAGDGCERGGNRPTSKNLLRISKMNLDAALSPQLGETVREKDKALRGKLQCSK